MNLIDTHCHLYLEEFSGDIDAVIRRATAEGVEKFYLPSIDSGTLTAMLNLEKQFPGKCFAMTGLHPCSVKGNHMQELKIVEDSLSQRDFAAIGEIGLDFYWDRSFEKEQYAALHQQIEWALQFDIPIVIHSRESMKETIQVVRGHQRGSLRGIFHCFTGSYDSAKEIIELGFFLGIGGVVTYKNAGLPAVLKNIGLGHMVLETDSPYLTPVPFRGKRNESAYLKYIAAKLAALKEVSVEELAKLTTENAAKIFGR
jgi:TatD DNase family protein